MEQKIDPPNLGFWNSEITHFQTIYAISQKHLLGARETEMLKDKVKQKTKKFNFKSNFLCDGAKNRPPNLGFWNSYLAHFQIIYAISQKNS